MVNAMKRETAEIKKSKERPKLVFCGTRSYLAEWQGAIRDLVAYRCDPPDDIYKPRKSNTIVCRRFFVSRKVNNNV